MQPVFTRHPRPGRVVGRDDRPGQGIRYRPLLGDLLQRHRRLQRVHRAGKPQPRDRRALWLRIPGDHHRRHGGGPETARRPPWHPAALLCRGRLDGRVSGPGVERCATRRWSAPPFASHRPPLSTQAIAFNAVGRMPSPAIPDWRDGQYSGTPGPEKGLAIARMVGHITYLSELLPGRTSSAGASSRPTA
jgi:hypothetical protein